MGTRTKIEIWLISILIIITWIHCDGHFLEIFIEMNKLLFKTIEYCFFKIYFDFSIKFCDFCAQFFAQPEVNLNLI